MSTHYPTFRLLTLCKIFKWETYEKSTLGSIGRDLNHGRLRWYAVILLQWVNGNGLSFIIERALDYKRRFPMSGVKVLKGNVDYENIYEEYKDTIEHRNSIISDTLRTIENIILFSLSNYFLRFSTEYKRFHNVESFPNDWHEYVEYGTTNPLSIMLQRNGFSRETSTYIRQHRADYVIEMPTQEIKLRKSIINCPSASVRREVADMQYNLPDLFIE